jgi:hypothetical protein
MGFRYYTTVNFSASARKIPAVNAYLNDKENFRGPSLDYEDDLEIQIIDNEASFGEVAITDVLCTCGVPYDHYHRITDASGCDENYTEYMRFPNGIEKGELLSITESERAAGELAEDMLKLLDEGKLEELRVQLVNKARSAPPGSFLDWEPTPEQMAMTGEEE